ncbi:hypothetical protein Bbelb_256080 [Branchiostoma belcheri]|nr:hypothetical protein Bbelb_256080 [Branchiostoma belcheri]
MTKGQLTTYQPSIVSKAAKVQQMGIEDSLAVHQIINKFSKALQAHCERLADYLLCGKGEWWILQQEVVVFQDGSSQPDSLHQGLAPEMLYFRSSSLRTVKQHLHNSRDENTVIPLRESYMYETHGERYLTAIKRTNVIPTFKACSEDLGTAVTTHADC